MILVFPTAEEVAQAAADRFIEQAHDSIRDHGVFSVALSGGSTPRRMYELLATTQFNALVEWSGVHIFFGDERTVPHNHPDSNFLMAQEALISRVPIPPGNVHPINGIGDATANAKSYEVELRKFFSGSEWPQFDLVLLGLGNDGHTASLFPTTSALKAREWVVANWVEEFQTYRLTLTAPAINAAAHVEFLVTGKDKASALAAVLEGPVDPEHLPAQLIRPESNSLRWLVDAQAASKLAPVLVSSSQNREAKRR